MYSPERIEKALEFMFGLFDSDDIDYLKANYEAELDDISPALLSKEFTRLASKPFDYRMTNEGIDGITFMGKPITQQRAMYLLSDVESTIEEGGYNATSFWELYLMEDMTFQVIHCLQTICELKHGRSITEYRTVIKRIESAQDIFFVSEDLVCALDDFCMFAELALQRREKEDEQNYE